jgi:hypothetical protein
VGTLRGSRDYSGIRFLIRRGPHGPAKLSGLTGVLCHLPVLLALKTYDRLRRDRADAVVTAARRLGRVAPAESQFGCAVRDAAARWTPQALMSRRLRRLWSFV